MAKRTGAEKQFCAVPKKSIKLLAESVGIECLSNEVATTLAEDISYRIRQTAQSANQFLMHSKRDHMTGEDINRALFWSHVEPIYGYGSKNSNVFSSISTKEGDLYFHEDKEIDLRELTFSKGVVLPSDSGNSEINVEVSVLDSSSSSKKDDQNSGEIVSSSLSKETDFENLDPLFRTYYHKVTRNIITANDKTVKVIFDDLKVNARVQVLLPYLVNFITTVMQSLSDDMTKLLRILGLIKALADNKQLYLQPYVVQLVRSVMYCLVEKPMSKSPASWCDDWILRRNAAQILCHIDRKCNNNAGNFLHLQLLGTLKDIYTGKDQALHSQYGAITGLSFLAFDAVKQTIFPYLKEYGKGLISLQDSDPKPDTMVEVLHIFDSLKISALSVFHNKLRDICFAMEKQDQLEKTRGNKTSNGAENTLDQKIWSRHLCEWYQILCDILGDSFVLLLGNLEDYQHFTQRKKRVGHQSSLLNHSGQEHVRKLIKSFAETREKNAPTFVSFSLEAEKSRREQEMLVGDNLQGFLGGEDSKLRFENLLESSAKSKQSFDLKCRIGRLLCLKRTTVKRSMASFTLSLPL